MVFRSVSENESQPLRNTSGFAMASSTVKSNQPLHNFPLQDLKWSMNHSNNHRFRKPNAVDSSHKSPHPDSSESDVNLVCDDAKNGNSASSSDRRTEKPVKKSTVSEATAENSETKSKIFIRLRAKSNKSTENATDAGDQTTVADDAEESVPKTWNLRPRRAVTKPPNAIEAASKAGETARQEIKAQMQSRPELTRSRNANDAKVPGKKEKEREKKKKKRFSIPLTKEEIEEDIYALTGSKPARRPGKRVKHVQKQLDFLFPGLWLASITPDSYKVPDASTKG